ncbi:translesion error-prone DNA polymerase V autoproteolytic subunit [Shewanella psychropiezotolerans]|uniref:Translesion error-prone DNA polymerase V autoproteolytic subunit n=1 Tax=Shewanella psychropiezotolerans TaxID=2593655 RepID=A0ABX5WTI6_9GAMM|nr:translesion error-prone DNA polymerase V autoproteolytic subunit [Shewanella psychropiezotolerans]QDO82410.1 translesion error-prone DNA polymerase V autoproteolytic subunit [Shewanella psychropiezotolerans]
MKVIPNTASVGITGFESPAAEYIQRPLSLDELLIAHPSSTFFGHASGESMRNVGIFDGDILIIDRHVTAQNGDVVVANYNGEFVCKLIDTVRKRLLSANDEHQPLVIHEHDQFCIEGVVVSSIRCHRPSPLLTASI